VGAEYALAEKIDSAFYVFVGFDDAATGIECLQHDRLVLFRI
jgi:hypothetical protein